MNRDRLFHKQRSSVILDAGYVSIQSIGTTQSSLVFGLHGTKSICVFTIVIFLSLLSLINLTFLLWIMYKIDWSPFRGAKGSDIFRFDSKSQSVEFQHQSKFHDALYTGKLNSFELIESHAQDQIDIYGDQNSVVLNPHQISMNTEHFRMGNHSSINFFDFHSFKFDWKKNTRIHLDRIRSQYVRSIVFHLVVESFVVNEFLVQIHQKQFRVTTKQNLFIKSNDRMRFTSLNLTLATNPRNRKSILKFRSPTIKTKFEYPRQKISEGNLHFKGDSISLDLRKYPIGRNSLQTDWTIYRLCVCNTTFLLLRSFAHQPCPLC